MLEILKGVGFGDNIADVKETKDATILKLKNDTGDGTMTVYPIFPGVIIIYNDFHMSDCVSQFQADNSNLLCIDHCREGCMKHEAGGMVQEYLNAGDLCVDIRKYHAGNVTFPVNHFHGISIGFYLPEAGDQLKQQLSGFSVSLQSIQEKFCENNKPHVIKANEEILHIFSELYHVPFKIRKEYFRIKIFELLLFLDAIEIEVTNSEQSYFYKNQVEKVYAIQRLLTGNLTHYYTIDELAEKFELSTTTLKKCFKSVFGSPVFQYMKIYRMNAAATILIREKEKTIAEISGLVGYDSPSKFAQAFKKVMGTTPLNYRNDRKEQI